MVRLYTRAGDEGQTGLAGGTRVDKDSLRVEAYGTLDELNAHLGVAAGLLTGSSTNETALLLRLQHELFILMAELATASGKSPRAQRVGKAHTARLEKEIDHYMEGLGPIRSFYLPRGSPAGAQLHVARTVARRAERQLVRLHHVEALRPELLAYVNRLSDLLFAMALAVNRAEGFGEVPPDYSV